MWQINDRIFLGNSADGYRHQIFIESNGVFIRNPDKTHVTLNVANDLPLTSDVTCGFADGPGNSDWSYRHAVDSLFNLLQYQRDPVLVHCHEGRSRSVCTIAAYMALYSVGGTGDMDSELEYIRAKREDINPHEIVVADFKRIFEI